MCLLYNITMYSTGEAHLILYPDMQFLVKKLVFSLVSLSFLGLHFQPLFSNIQYKSRQLFIFIFKVIGSFLQYIHETWGFLFYLFPSATILPFKSCFASLSCPLTSSPCSYPLRLFLSLLLIFGSFIFPSNVFSCLFSFLFLSCLSSSHLISHFLTSPLFSPPRLIFFLDKLKNEFNIN